ncbi:MAG: hypothetical protein H6662_18385 [Ardenticatenaceae bacterium]|nr:hypothetical protein [Anaerolineales bacterium]MCB8923560.1 hypothetical protein [Ardenticatenaceae bacterium]MCB8991708.1 hypothetical protein [Ardenticatenaceae bacterium]
MPTKPHDGILYRELSIVEARETIDIVSKLLQEQINFGTNALVRCITSTNGGIDEDLAVFAIYRHMLEITDGIEVLLSQACVNPAVPLLRSSFESYLAIDFILESDAKYTERSLSWLVGYVHERLHIYERLDPATSRGKSVEKLFAEDPIASTIFPLDENLQLLNGKAITNLESFLSKKHVEPVEVEYSRHKNPKWHALFDGPKTTWELAKHLQMGGFYEILFRQWSRNTHAQDLLPFIHRTDRGEAAIGKIRNAQQLSQTASLASTFLLGVTYKVVKKFRPGEDLSNWFKREIFEYRKALR